MTERDADMMRRLLVGTVGTIAACLIAAAPVRASTDSLTVTAFLVDQQCRGGDIVSVTLSATVVSSSEVRGFRWDFNNDGRWDTGILSEPTVVHPYPDEVTVTARVGAVNVEGNRAVDRIMFTTLRCG
jgi:hypothetical protein